MRPFRLRAGARSGLLPISREDSLTDFLKECDLGVKQTGRALFMKGIRSRFTRDGFRKDYPSALVLKQGYSRGPAAVRIRDLRAHTLLRRIATEEGSLISLV